jgi:uncharacterized membrane protein YphA (DoxX/SURF4 family)
MMDLSTPVAVLVTLAEIAGGVGILVGAYTNDLITRLAGLAIAAVMLGAIIMVHWGRWDFMAGGDGISGGVASDCPLFPLDGQYGFEPKTLTKNFVPDRKGSLD